MNKFIEILPFDDEMKVLVTALQILNDFKRLGFVKRDAFVELIMSEDVSYHNFSAMQKLNNFWAGRVKDDVLNTDLQRILENVKTS